MTTNDNDTNVRLAILGSRGVPARYGGFETFAEEISWRLVEQGVDVTVFCEGGGPRTYRGIQLEYVAIKNLGPLTTILFDMRSLWRARKGYDVVYMLGYGTSFFCFLPRLWGSKIWINMDGIEWKRSKWSGVAKLWFRFMERFATWTANRLIVDANGIASHMMSRYRQLPAMTMIPYGVELPEFPEAAPILENYGVCANDYALVVCRIEPENHVLEIVEGYQQIATNCPLLVVGSLVGGQPYSESLRRLESSKIRFLGGIYDQRQLWTLRQQCRVYFHGHSVGGTNPSLLEAMAAGNVIVAHDNKFNREVIGESGMYFTDNKSVMSTGEAAMNLETATKMRLSDAMERRVATSYSWPSIFTRYHCVLMEDACSY